MLHPRLVMLVHFLGWRSIDQAHWTSSSLTRLSSPHVSCELLRGPFSQTTSVTTILNHIVALALDAARTLTLGPFVIYPERGDHELPRNPCRNAVALLTPVNNLVDSGRLPHLLFYGPPGTGKTSTCLALARKLNGPGYRNLVLEVRSHPLIASILDLGLLLAHMSS